MGAKSATQNGTFESPIRLCQAEITDAPGHDDTTLSPGWRWVLPPTQAPCWCQYGLGFAAMTLWYQTLSPLWEYSISARIHRSFSLGNCFRC